MFLQDICQDSQPTYINTTMQKVSYPFHLKWNITLSPSFYNITGMPLESCGLGYYTGCNYTSCGSTCSNSYSTPNHHKNFDYNCLFAKANYGYSGWDIGMVISSAKPCHMHSAGVHDYCGLGMVPYVGDNFAMAKLITANDQIKNVRVIQHELSHCFCCRDNECTSYGNCIMSGGFDLNPNFYITNIWCDQCKSRFNRTQH